MRPEPENIIDLNRVSHLVSLNMAKEVLFMLAAACLLVCMFAVVSPLLGGAIGSTVSKGETTHSVFHLYLPDFHL